MEVLGANFGNEIAKVEITINNILCPMVSVDHTRAACMIGEGYGPNYPLAINVTGRIARSFFSYDGETYSLIFLYLYYLCWCSI